MAWVSVIPDMIVADTDLCLDVPVSVEDPLVAVGHAGTGIDTLAAKIADIFRDIVT